jgi:hypothetical protein
MKDPGWERSTWGEAVQGRDERPRLKLVDNRPFRSGVVLTSHRTDG